MATKMTIRHTGYVLMQIVIVVVMFLMGMLIWVLSIMSAPENFENWEESNVSSLGAIRFFLGFFVLLLIPWYRKIPLVLILAGGFYILIAQGDPYVAAIGLTVWLVRAHKPWHWNVAYASLAVIGISLIRHLLAVQRWGDGFDRAQNVTLVLSIGGLLVGTVLAIAFMTRQRRRIHTAQEIVSAAQHDRRVISDQMTRQTEREFLAREVHDTLAQRLTALSLQTGHLQRSVENQSNPQLWEALQETQKYSDQALRDLRNLVTSLREHGEPEPEIPAVAPQGFEDIKALVDDAAHQGLSVRPFIMVNGYDQAPDELQRAVLRITQEALTNVMRHSTEQTVSFHMEGQPGVGLLLEYRNQYLSQDRFDAGSGTGLLGITERAELIGGAATTHNGAEEFVLTVNLPWDEASQTP